MKPPVLLILFNRPDLTEELFSIIEENCGHRKIYIAIDGPRQNNDSDSKLCAEVVHLANNFASQHKDHCRLLIQPKNLGCGNGVKSAIDWFFENEEMGIILEDDCHPCADFFSFQDEMLLRYCNNPDISIITGVNFIPHPLRVEQECYLSKYTFIWGWGTWKRMWNKYLFYLCSENSQEFIQAIDEYCDDKNERLFWNNILNSLVDNKNPYTWDFQLLFASWKWKCKALCPARNLIINKGMREDATHTTTNNASFVNKHEVGLLFPIQNPVSYNKTLDALLFYYHILEAKSDRIKKLFLDQDISQSNSLDPQVEDARKKHKIIASKGFFSKIFNHKKNENSYPNQNVEPLTENLCGSDNWKSKYDVGRESYGNPRILSWGERSTLKVGKFCSIAEEVKIFLGGNHRTDWVTTFPFSALWPSAKHITGHPSTRGDVVIGHEVWIGYCATILSGVTIGNGAVIGAFSVVVKDVPPYSIVVGNPAKVVKKRFTDDKVEILQELRWWDWENDKLNYAMEHLLCGDIDKLIHINREFNKNSANE